MKNFSLLLCGRRINSTSGKIYERQNGPLRFQRKGDEVEEYFFLLSLENHSLQGQRIGFQRLGHPSLFFWSYQT